MSTSSYENVPESLLVLRKHCARLFTENRIVVACETPILLHANGSVSTERVSLFVAPYDLYLTGSYYYLWWDLRRIEWGIGAGGYSNKEIALLNGFMENLSEGFDAIPHLLDSGPANVLRSLNLLN